MSLIFKFTFSTELKDEKKIKKLEHRKQLEQANSFITIVSDEVGQLRQEKDELTKALADTKEELDTCKVKLNQTMNISPQVTRYQYVILITCTSNFNNVFLGEHLRTSVTESQKAKKSKYCLSKKTVLNQRYVMVGLLLFLILHITIFPVHHA